LWGILARRLSNCDRLLCPEDIVEEIRKEVTKPGVRSWLGVAEVHVEVVEGYLPWRDHLTERLSVGLEGGLKEDTSANHLFLFLLRRGAPCL
jgi:hypothetical protein